MNDRYLYCAKRTDNGEWVEGYLFDDGFENGRMFVGGLVIEEYHGTACDDWSITGINFYEVDPSTICRYTGLKDKNGKLIWENDIVSGKMYLDHGQWGEYVDDKRIVEWDDAYARFIPCSYMKLDKYEVIGNIFDNPELLEAGE